jgi:hypothetical protein
MREVTTIGLDIAKSVFQVHGASLVKTKSNQTKRLYCENI